MFNFCVREDIMEFLWFISQWIFSLTDNSVLSMCVGLYLLSDAQNSKH